VADATLIAEFECPACGVDEDIAPAPALGSEHRCLNCGRETTISEANTNLLRDGTRGATPAAWSEWAPHG
jgi:predicted RNA-binding Zn-ribbon protein involved in translation (DUF1610 family)